MIRKLRLLSLIAASYFKRDRGKITALFVIPLILVFLAVRFGFIDTLPVVSEGFIGTYQSHDLPAEVTRLISKGLVEADKSGRVNPSLALSWQTNNDATVFTFKLKPDLKWTDGTFLKSSDLEFPIPDVSVTYPDDHTIQFKLKDSYSPFPTLLTKPLYKKGTMTGVGPYRLSKTEKSRIFITRLTLLPVDAGMPKVYIRFYPNEKTAMTGFTLGEVQVLAGIANPDGFQNSPLLGLIQKTDYGKIIAVLYNTKDPLLSNRSIRQALSYITPQIAKEVTADNPLSVFSWAYNKDAKKYLANNTAAEGAFERAKSSVAGDLLKKEIILTATPNLEAAGKKIVEAWKSLGLDAKLRVESGIPQKFSALLITQSIPLDPDQYFLWHSTQDKTNISKYSSECCPASARVDKDLEDGRKTIAEEDRKAKYLDFQKTLLEDMPAAFLYYPKYNILYLRKAETGLNKLLPVQLSAEYN